MRGTEAVELLRYGDRVIVGDTWQMANHSWIGVVIDVTPNGGILTYPCDIAGHPCVDQTRWIPYHYVVSWDDATEESLAELERLVTTHQRKKRLERDRALGIDRATEKRITETTFKTDEVPPWY